MTAAPNLTNDVLAHALSYAARGWHVFPCVTGEKVPATLNGCKDASADESQIRYWLAARRTANLAIACGPSRLVVLDVDTKREDGFAALHALESEIGELPVTYTVRTPSTGEHRYFRALEGVEIRNSASKLGPGIDVRASGGYVLAPPSQIDGAGYVLTLDADVAELPSAWIERIAPRERERETVYPRIQGFASDGRRVSAYVLRALQDEARSLASTPRGQRNDRLWRSAAALGGLVHLGVIDCADIRRALGWACGQWAAIERDARKDRDTLERGLRFGLDHPREAHRAA